MKEIKACNYILTFLSLFCAGVVSREMLDKMENAKIIGTLTKEFNEVIQIIYLIFLKGDHFNR